MSVDSENEVLVLQVGLIKVLKNASFELVKWVNNTKATLKNVQAKNRVNNSLTFSKFTETNMKLKCLVCSGITLKILFNYHLYQPRHRYLKLSFKLNRCNKRFQLHVKLYWESKNRLKLLSHRFSEIVTNFIIP